VARPTLDELIEDERMKAEDISKAFIRHSIARHHLIQRLKEIREAQPELFTTPEKET
jgi:hypothetical protein